MCASAFCGAARRAVVAVACRSSVRLVGNGYGCRHDYSGTAVFCNCHEVGCRKELNQ